MGYYTNFEVTLQAPVSDKDVSDYMTPTEADDLFENLSDYSFRPDEGYVRERQSVKWYDCDYDCQAMSFQYPNIVIRVYGEGEEPHDVWCKWWRAGKLLRRWKLEYSVPDAWDDKPEAS